MQVASLVLWIITALGGSYLLATWLAKGGRRHTNLPVPVLFSHLGLAAAGLVLWITYVLTDIGTIAWIAFALLLVVALLGFMMVARWAGDRTAGASTERAAEQTPAEQQFPPAAVYGHGALAVVTVVLVLLTAGELVGG